MKKRIFSVFLVLCLLGSLTATAFADSYSGKEGLTVTFTADQKVDSNLNGSEVDRVKDLQPGDDITFSVTLVNQYSESTRWYMANKVLQSLEDNGGGSGGAYSYHLYYTDPNGESTDIYKSETFGGDTVTDGREGLRQATAGLEDYFSLGVIPKGGSAQITVKVALDGETQGNAYEESLADLRMNFAVETLSDSTATGSRTGVVKTGDDTNLFPFYVAMVISGLLILLLAVDSLKKREKERGEMAQ